MQEHTGVRIWSLIHELGKLQKQSYQIPNLTHLETRLMYTILRLSKDSNEQVNVSALKHRLNVSHPTISQTVNTLEQYGYLVRVKDPDDGRITLIELSDKGRAALQEAFEIVSNTFIAMSEHLGEEKSEAFIALLEEMIDYFKNNGGQ